MKDFLVYMGSVKKNKQRIYNEFGTKGWRVSDLNHYSKQLYDSEKGGAKIKQAENGLQSRSSENGSVALWIKIAVILNWR